MKFRVISSFKLCYWSAFYSANFLEVTKNFPICAFWHLTCDTWHVTAHMWHMTRDRAHVTHGGWWTYSQNFSSLALMVCTSSFRIWLLWCLFCQVQLFPVNHFSKTDCPQKRKSIFNRSTWRRSLQTFCLQASCVSFWRCLSKYGIYICLYQQNF